METKPTTDQGENIPPAPFICPSRGKSPHCQGCTVDDEDCPFLEDEDDEAEKDDGLSERDRERYRDADRWLQKKYDDEACQGHCLFY